MRNISLELCSPEIHLVHQQWIVDPFFLTSTSVKVRLSDESRHPVRAWVDTIGRPHVHEKPLYPPYVSSDLDCKNVLFYYVLWAKILHTK